ncbi:DUF3857 domain-containing protein [candidate division KSB1 bacterium]|nr:DUF3857 domain-containing protein [candidate division KSB1 bacterium]
MNPIKLLFLSIFLFSGFAFSENFIRNLPSEQLRKLLTPEKFKNMDAVIVLKENSFQIQESSIEYHGISLIGPRIQKTSALIVKLFNEKAVQRYGTFEFDYRELLGNQIRNPFEARVRILKESGDIWVMPKKQINTIVSREFDGSPIARKVIFKIPNLSVGDILQIEYSFAENFSLASSGVFYFHDRDFTLFSNLYITLPAKCQTKFTSLPQGKIPDPQITQVSKNWGAGETYFWSLQNLKPIPDESFSTPFTDVSYKTAFIIDRWDNQGESEANWTYKANNFYKNFIKKDNVNEQQLEELGFAGMEQEPVGRSTTDRLYTALREAVSLYEFNSLYPQSENIKSIFKTGKGDASDMAYIMYSILKKWDQTVKIAWIRDIRQGRFEITIPTAMWFDRLGVLVTIDGEEVLYDFDRSVPVSFQTPWFLKGLNVVVIDESGYEFKTIGTPATIRDNIYKEFHHLELKDDMSIYDNIEFTNKGIGAEEFRENNYGLEENKIIEKLTGMLTPKCLSSVDSVSFNNYKSDTKVDIKCAGHLPLNAIEIDSFMVFKLNNYTFSDFKDKIFSTYRQNDVNLKTPFQVFLTWEVALPNGYKIKTTLENANISGPGHAASAYNFYSDNETIKISCHIKFPEIIIPKTQFPQLLTFLDETLAKINQDIILEKEKGETSPDSH